MKNKRTLWCLAAAAALLSASPAAADEPILDPWADKSARPAPKPSPAPPIPDIIDPWNDPAHVRGHQPSRSPRSGQPTSTPSDRRASMPPATRDSTASRLNTPAFGSGLGIGVSVQPLSPALCSFFGTPHDAGVLVSRVGKDGLGAKAGIRVGDVLVKIDRASISSQRSLHRALHHKRAGDTAVITVVRAKRSIVLRLTFPTPKPGDAALVARKHEIRALRQTVSFLKAKLLELEKRLELLEAGSERGDPRLGSRQ